MEVEKLIKMKFIKNNQETDIHPETILDNFLLSEQFKNWRFWYYFEAELISFLMDNYGTYDDKDYEKLKDYILRNWESRLKHNIIFAGLN